MEINEEIYLSGTVENITFYNPDTLFGVIEIFADGEAVTVVGQMPELLPGEKINAIGTWVNNEKFGKQFRITSLTRALPETAAEMLAFLSSGAVKGIGPKTAAKIIEKFGDESFDIIEDHPEKLATIRGLSEEKCKRISKAFKRDFESRQTLIKLEKYGLTALECTRIYEQLGDAAPILIESDPYILCEKISGISFSRVETIAQLLPDKPPRELRITAGIRYVLRHNLWSKGHCCVPADKLSDPCIRLLEADAEEIDTTVDDMVQKGGLVRTVINDRVYLSLPEVFDAEQNISNRMKEILKYPPYLLDTVDSQIDRTESSVGTVFADKQREAIRTAVTKGLLILTGGPGTGKTTTVKGIIDIYEKLGFDIKLTAPTGRAAKRITEITGRDAKTIHRLLECEYDKKGKMTFRKNEDDPLKVQVLIVDEMSMVDIFLFSSLLEALPRGCRLILVGDPDQLPPVGPGNVLADLIGSGMMPVIRLDQIFRQAQKSLIITNAHTIINGKMPELDKKDNDFFFIASRNSSSSADTIIDLVARRLPFAYGADALSSIQILCPSKKGECGSHELNRRLRDALNPPDPSKYEFKTGQTVFRLYDKVMQVKNNYNLEWSDGEDEGIGVYNGDMGVIKGMDLAAQEAIIDFDGRIVSYPFANATELEHAYAVTVHKSQGSEFDFVIIPVIDAPEQLLYRNLLYTAVTRARKILILIGSKDKIGRMVANNVHIKRFSQLDSLLTNNIEVGAL